MIEHLRNFLKNFSAVCPLVVGLVCAFTPDAVAWTSANLEEVAITVELAETGPSRVVTQVRYMVNGGKFHGFDFAELPGSVLDKEASRAALDDGRVYPLTFRQLRNGNTRVLLANKAEAGRGGVNFAIIHTIDFIANGYLRMSGGRAELDWTPVVWNEGLLSAKVEVVLPGASRDGPIVADAEVSKDYVVTTHPDRIEVTKYRPVRWYPMRILLSFDPSLVGELEEAPPAPTAPLVQASTASVSSHPPPPPHVESLPFLVVFFGFIFLVFKGLHVLRSHQLVGLEHRFALLSDTGLGARLALSVLALAVGVGAQHAGSVAAGIPALAIAAGLWLSKKQQMDLSLKGGGTWRMMDSGDVARLQELTREYQRARRSWLDITSVPGTLAFLLYLSCLGYGVLETRILWADISWVIFLDGLLLGIPAWFSSVRSELPIDTTIESFSSLYRLRKKLAEIVQVTDRGSGIEFWLREDEGHPIEVRLRVAFPLEMASSEGARSGLNGIEIAGENLRSGSLYRTRIAVVIRTEPGTETARRVAGSPHAVEHHLTPDLQEEIIVLRNRRGRSLGMTPLRGALAVLPR